MDMIGKTFAKVLIINVPSIHPFNALFETTFAANN